MYYAYMVVCTDKINKVVDSRARGEKERKSVGEVRMPAKEAERRRVNDSLPMLGHHGSPCGGQEEMEWRKWSVMPK